MKTMKKYICAHIYIHNLFYSSLLEAPKLQEDRKKLLRNGDVKKIHISVFRMITDQ